MKKNVIALAVAAAMTAPLAAQAEVKVSGQLQAEVVSLGGDGAVEGLYLMDGSEMAKENSGNAGFLKFAASEDLGGGMKALAMANMNIKADENSSIGARDAYVGLTGGFGTVLAGRISTPYKSSTVKWDPFLATSAQARGSYGMSGLHNSYAANVLAYANKFGMAKVVAAVAFDEGADPDDATQTAGNHGMTFSVNMPVGPVEVALAYIDVSEHQDASSGGAFADDSVATKVGVKYTAGAITVAGQHEMLDDGLGDQTFTYLTGSYTAGANTFSAAYGMNNEDTADQDNSYMAIGMKHAFSKSTSAHVTYRASDDDGDADVTALGAGLRVKF